MTLHGLAPALSQALFVRSATAPPLVVESVTAEPTMPSTCGSVVCLGPSAVPWTTTGMPAAIAARAHGMSGGPETALSTNASYFFEAIASWQLASSRCTPFLESEVVTVALLAFPVSLALLMITCSTGLAWIATKCAMLTCLFASPELEAVLEPPDDALSSESLPPQATTPTIAADSARPTTARLMALSSSCADSAQMCAPRPCAQRPRPPPTRQGP